MVQSLREISVRDTPTLEFFNLNDLIALSIIFKSVNATNLKKGCYRIVKVLKTSKAGIVLSSVEGQA